MSVADPWAVWAIFALISEITDFQAELDDDSALIRLRLTARMVRESDARVMARRVFFLPAFRSRTPKPCRW